MSQLEQCVYNNPHRNFGIHWSLQGEAPSYQSPYYVCIYRERHKAGYGQIPGQRFYCISPFPGNLN